MSMLFLWLCGCVFAPSIAVEKPVYDIEKAQQLFEEFIITHNKRYPHNIEKQKRFEIFKDNLKHIIELNLASEAVRAITRFTDLTTEEFVSKYTGFSRSAEPKQPNTCKVIKDEDIATNDAPASLDWRQRNVVTPVKDQLSCGTCWAFATIANIESRYALKHSELISLSEQQLIDCLLQSSEHCNVGDTMVDVMSELKTAAGIQSETDYPYSFTNHVDQECKFDESKVKVQIRDCYRFNFKDENKFKEALFKFGPIAIGLNATTWNKYHGGIYDAFDCGVPIKVNHGVLLVGYGTEGSKDYWIIKNSWDKSFGEGGYIKITRGENTCGFVNDEATCAVVL